MSTWQLTSLRGIGSVPLYTEFIDLRTAGYTGSLADMKRQNFLALLGLTEPQLLTTRDLEMMYWRSLGKTGSLTDMRHQP